MTKKQFIVTMVVDENHNIARERIECGFCDSVDEYIYKQIRCFENKYENINSLKQGIEEWGEWTEYKELTNGINNKELLKQANELLNQAVEVITFLEDLSGLSKCGYNNDKDKEYVENFFDKLKEYGEKDEKNNK